MLAGRLKSNQPLFLPSSIAVSYDHPRAPKFRSTGQSYFCLCVASDTVLLLCSCICSPSPRVCIPMLFTCLQLSCPNPSQSNKSDCHFTFSSPVFSLFFPFLSPFHSASLPLSSLVSTQCSSN